MREQRHHPVGGGELEEGGGGQLLLQDVLFSVGFWLIFSISMEWGMGGCGEEYLQLQLGLGQWQLPHRLQRSHFEI